MYYTYTIHLSIYLLLLIILIIVGHGGRKTVEFVKDNLPAVLLKEMEKLELLSNEEKYEADSYDKAVIQAMKQSYSIVDDKITKLCKEAKDKSGMLSDIFIYIYSKPVYIE